VRRSQHLAGAPPPASREECAATQTRRAPLPYSESRRTGKVRVSSSHTLCRPHPFAKVFASTLTGRVGPNAVCQLPPTCGGSGHCTLALQVSSRCPGRGSGRPFPYTSQPQQPAMSVCCLLSPVCQSVSQQFSRTACCMVSMVLWFSIESESVCFGRSGRHFFRHENSQQQQISADSEI
jgi:hypothetical protein